jgi:P-type Ca2+ transporter type 2C
MGRSVPYDKYVLAVGLKELGKTIACTGEGINDVDALRCADVGFAMGSGCSVAKDAADMVITSDNFEGTMMAVMWGRNIYANVRKFIQFQVTCNLSVLAIVFLGVALKGTPPLSVVQLLWLNLVMDTFAAIALGSERPHPSIIKSPPVKENESILTPIMWRQIYGMSIWIATCMFILYFFIDDMWGFEYNNSDHFFVEGTPTIKCKVYTMLFNTFMFMTIFNEINCRKVGATEYNVFHNIIANWYFIVIVGGITALQWVFVQYGGILTNCHALTGEEFAFCVLWGASTMLISVILKLTPAEFFEKMPIVIDENKAIDENDPLLAAYNKQANAKALPVRGAAPAEDHDEEKL